MKGYNIDIGYVGYINGKYYLFAIEYDSETIHENDIVVTGFILNEYGECEYRVFDKVILKDTKGVEIGVE